MRKELLLTLILTACTAVMPQYATAQTGVYDPATARIAAEKVLSITKKILALARETRPSTRDDPANPAIVNTMTRYINIKEEQADLVQSELLHLWVGYFKPVHLAGYPDLHETIWNAAKLCDAVQADVSLEISQKLLEAVKNIHNIYWGTRGRKVPFTLATQ